MRVLVFLDSWQRRKCEKLTIFRYLMIALPVTYRQTETSLKFSYKRRTTVVLHHWEPVKFVSVSSTVGTLCWKIHTAYCLYSIWQQFHGTFWQETCPFTVTVTVTNIAYASGLVLTMFLHTRRSVYRSTGLNGLKKMVTMIKNSQFWTHTFVSIAFCM